MRLYVRRFVVSLACTVTLVLGAIAAASLADPGPSTPVLDGFDRANGALGGNWSAGWTGCVAMAVTSDAAASSSGSSGACAYWNGTQFPADQEAYATVEATNSEVDVGVRYNPGSGGYDCVYVPAAGTWSITNRTHSGGVSSLATLAPAVFLAAGDEIECRAVGTTVTELWGSGSPTTWRVMLSVTSTAYSGPGYLLLFSRDNSSLLDDFGGGAYVDSGSSTSTQTVYTGQATVTVGGGGGTGTLAMGSSCGDTTTDPAQPACAVELGAVDRGFLNNLHDDLFVLVGAVIGAALIPLIVKWFTALKG